MSDETLRYPADLKEEIGLNEKEINAFKRQGCPFHGRKTSVRWVRLFLDQISGADRLIYASEFPQCPLAKLLEKSGRAK